MPELNDVTIEDLTFAKNQLTQVNKRLANVKEDAYVGDDYDNPHEISPEDLDEGAVLIMAPDVIISDCQICVELSVKILFKCFGINPVERHDIDFSNQRVSGLLGRLPDEEEFSDNVPRMIFLTQFWERFYQLTKYGIPEENISSTQIMDKSDAIRAVQDADFCKNTVDDAFEYVLSQKGIEANDLDIHIF